MRFFRGPTSERPDPGGLCHPDPAAQRSVVLVPVRIKLIVGASFVTFVLGHQIELDAAVLFDSTADGALDDRRDQPSPQ